MASRCPLTGNSIEQGGKILPATANVIAYEHPAVFLAGLLFWTLRTGKHKHAI